MENQELIKEMNCAEQPPADDKSGKWVKVDRSSVGFDTSNLRPGEPVVGPDGATYYLGAGVPGYQEIEQGRHNAVPTPNNIVQMTPIVQPIALVPYASQNQPMLQYDPYQRPEAPKTVRQTYKRKPYPAISLSLAILSLVALVAMMLSAVIAPEGSAVKGASGLDVISSILVLCGITGIDSAYSAGIMTALDGNVLGILFAVFVLVLAIFFIVMFVQYLLRLVKGKSPRNFSFFALITLFLSIGAILVLSFINTKIAEEATVAQFISWKSQVGVGIGLYAAAFISLVMLILPFCTNRHAYVKDYSAEDETYIIKE